MNDTATAPSSQDLALLSHVLRDVARSRRLSAEDTQDFMQSAQVRLLERKYDVFQRFTGRSSLKTYLTVVATRLLLDWRNSVYGKWRASTAAVRLGEKAVHLEQLVLRDGYTTDEAISIISIRPGAPSKADLMRTAEQLPWRHRRRMVSDEALRDVGAGFEDPLEAAESARQERQVHRALARAMGQLSAEERWLIGVRYGQNRSVQTLARVLSTDAKKLYRRYNRALRSLRKSLLAAGVTRPVIFKRVT